MAIRRFGLFFLIGASLVSGFAQQTGGGDRRITLDVVVADKSGKPVPGLQQQDFTLLDNKQPQKIVSFQAGTTADPPVEAILVVDEANTSYSDVGLERLQIDKFLKMGGGELACPVSLVFLSDMGATDVTAASRNGNAIASELDQKQSALRTIRRSAGAYGAEDRTKISLTALQQLAEKAGTRPGRTLVIWISPGWPFLSGPNIELSSKSQQQIFGAIVSISDGLRRSRITLYAVDPLGTSDAVGYQTTGYRAFLKPAKKWQQVQIGNMALQVIASQSGGRVLNSSNDVAGEIAKCIADAGAFYAISFDGLSGDGPNEYHALEVKVDKPGLTARTRAGYYAQP